MDTTSQEQLEELRRNGRITEEEYQRLKEAMRSGASARAQEDVQPRQDGQQQTRHDAYPDRHWEDKAVLQGKRAPWQVWVVIVLLALEGVCNLIAIPDNPMNIAWIVAKCVFIYGLYNLHRWAFVVFCVIAALHVVGFAASAPVVAAINLFLIVMLATCFRRFFPSTTEAGLRQYPQGE